MAMPDGVLAVSSSSVMAVELCAVCEIKIWEAQLLRSGFTRAYDRQDKNRCAAAAAVMLGAASLGTL